MRKRHVKKLIVIASSAVAAAAASLVAISPAGAEPDQTGQSFADAKAALTNAGYDVVVSTKFGSALPLEDCSVIRQETTLGAPFSNGAFTRSGNQKVMVSLDCNPKRR